ncbi:hypothetical protein ACOME3_003672 [Neoechinorhynchus agilis]
MSACWNPFRKSQTLSTKVGYFFQFDSGTLITLIWNDCNECFDQSTDNLNSIWEALTKGAFVGFNFTDIPRRIIPTDCCPSDVTKNCLDLSRTLAHVLNTCEQSIRNLIGEMQLAFICATRLESCDSLIQYGRIVRILTYSETFMIENEDAYYDMILPALYFQLKTDKSIIDEFSTVSDNTFGKILKDLSVRLSEIAGKDCDFKQELLQQLNGYLNELVGDLEDEEDEEDAPVYVTLNKFD